MNEKRQRPDRQPQSQMLKGFDPVQEYADRLRAGCSCNNCLLAGTVECSICNHLDHYFGIHSIEKGI